MTNNPLDDDRKRRDPGSIVVNGEVVPTDLEAYAAWLNRKPTGKFYYVIGVAPHRQLATRDLFAK